MVMLNPKDIEKIPLELINQINSILNGTSKNILKSMDSVNLLIKSNSLKFSDTGKDVNLYNHACKELLKKEALILKSKVIHFKQNSNDDTNYMHQFLKILHYTKEPMLSITKSLGIDRQEDLDLIDSMYHYNYARMLANRLISEKENLNRLHSLDIDSNEFKNTFKFETNIYSLCNKYASAINRSGFDLKFFSVIVSKESNNNGYNANKVAKSIYISVLQLYIRLISCNKNVLPNYSNYCKVKEASKVSLMNDLDLTGEDINKSVFKPVSQALNSMYDNLSNSPQLCETIDITLENLRKGYVIIKKNTSLNLVYNLNDVDSVNAPKLHRYRARHLLRQLKISGRRNDYNAMISSMRKSNITFKDLKISEENAKILITVDINNNN